MRRRQVVIGPETKIVRIAGRPSRLLITLIAVQLGLFLLYAFAEGPAWVGRHLALSAGQALGLFQVWQLLTAPWIHLGSREVLVNLVTLWVLGAPLQRWWGPRRLLLFYVITGFGGMVTALLLGLLWPTRQVAGSAGASAALLVAFAVIFSDHLVFVYRGVLPLKAKWLGLLLLGFVLLGDLLRGAYLQVALELGGGLTALLFVYSPRRLLGALRLRRAKRKFKVIEGQRSDDGPTYLN
jgi:membrane associated rhomboid family serine protease